jgi:hypothetical protein
MIKFVPIFGLGNKASKTADCEFFMAASQGEVSVEHSSHLVIEIILRSS